MKTRALLLLITILLTPYYLFATNTCPSPLVEKIDLSGIVYCEFGERFSDPVLLQNNEGKEILFPIYSSSNQDLLKSSQVFNSNYIGATSSAMLPTLSEAVIRVNATENKLLTTLEIAGVSSDDCLQYESITNGISVVMCSEEENPFSGTYYFNYYTLDNGVLEKQLAEDFPFPITENTFLPVLNPNSSHLIARGIIVDITAFNILTDSEQPIYVGIKFKPEIDKDSINQYERMIHTPYSNMDAASSEQSDFTRLAYPGYAIFATPVTTITSSVSGAEHISHFAARYTLQPTAGSGSIILQPYSVYNCEQLQYAFSNSYVRLENNIICDSYSNFVPIEPAQAIIFDGNYKTISGLTISSPELDSVGLFKSLPSGSSVHNLTLNNINVLGRNSAGILAGAINVNSNLRRITIENSNLSGKSVLGGLAGRLFKDTRLEDISVDVNIEGQGLLGGIAGSLSGGSLINVSTSGSIEGYYNLAQIAGFGAATLEENMNRTNTLTWRHAPLPGKGDGDMNGIVDINDYQIWKFQMGASITPKGFGGDFNGDGTASLGDYTTWRNHLGASY